MDKKYLSFLDKTTENFVDVISDVILKNKKQFEDAKTKEEMIKTFNKLLQFTKKSNDEPSLKGLTNNGKPVLGKKSNSKENKCSKPSLISLETYLDTYKNESIICGFQSSKGPNIGKVCGATLCQERIEFWKEKEGDDIFKYRCSGCKLKTGTIEKNLSKFGKTILPDNSRPGYNVTKQINLENDDQVLTINMKNEDNIPEGYNFIDSDKFPGLVIFEDSENDLKFVGKVVDEEGNTVKIKKSTLMEKNWEKNLNTKLTSLEKAFLKNLSISFDESESLTKNKKTDSDSESIAPLTNKKTDSDSDSESVVPLTKKNNSDTED